MMIACAVVAVLALLAGSLVLTDGDSEAKTSASDGLGFEPVYGAGVSYSEYDETFTIHMRVGDVFSYQPSTNYPEAVITASSDESNPLVWDLESGTLSGSFDDAGTYSTLLTATVDHGTVSQHAYQRITFVVYDRIAFAGSDSPGDITVTYAYALGDLGDGSRVYRVALASGLDMPTVSYSFDVAEGKEGVFSWDASTGAIVANKVLDASDEGEYVLTVTASYSSEGVADSATVTVNVTVKEGVIIYSPDEFDVILGDAEAQYEILTNKDGSIELTYGMTVDPGYDGVLALEEGIVTVDMGKAAELMGDSDSITFAMHLTVTEVGDESNTDSLDVTVTISEAPWTGAPVIDADSITAEPVDGDPSKVRVTVTIGHADEVVFAWGDGSHDVVDGQDDVYTFDHAYASGVENPVVIAVSATNGNGDAIGYIMYDITDGQWNWNEERPDVPGTGDDAGDSEPSFMDEHGILWIVFAIAALALALVFLFGERNGYFLIGIVVLALLAVAAFVTNDFGLELNQYL